MNREVRTLVKEKVPLNSYKVTWQLYLDSNLTATYVNESIEYIYGLNGLILEDITPPVSYKLTPLVCEGKEYVDTSRVIKARISSKVVTKTRYVDLYLIEEYEDDISIFGKLKGSRLMYSRYGGE